MFSLFRTPFFSHVGWGYHQWPNLTLHLKEKKEEGWKQTHRTQANSAGWSHSPLHRPRARRPRRAPPRAPCHPRGQSIGPDGDYCSPAAPVESRAQLMGHPQRSLSGPSWRAEIVFVPHTPPDVTHPRWGLANTLLFPQPHPDSRGNSMSTDTKALPHSMLLWPLPLPALTRCRKSCPCTPKRSFAPDTASLTVWVHCRVLTARHPPQATTEMPRCCSAPSPFAEVPRLIYPGAFGLACPCSSVTNNTYTARNSHCTIYVQLSEHRFSAPLSITSFAVGTEEFSSAASTGLLLV